jgi:hypothetical protein
MKHHLSTALILSSLLVSGCASNQNLPLMFGQSQTVGISIGGGVSEQGVDFVFGYKDKNIAIIPVAIEISEGKHAQVGSMSGEDFDDSFSVLGQFEVNTDTEEGNIGLGKFFATGAAAKALADGFASKLSNGEIEPEATAEPEIVVEPEATAEPEA